MHTSLAGTLRSYFAVSSERKRLQNIFHLLTIAIWRPPKGYTLKFLFRMLLSLIIPIYNTEPFIRKTLSSIFSQEEADSDEIEIIIVNDGTQDNAMDIVNEFALKHKNIKILEQENQGLAAARNKGINVAKGDYIWGIDSDDWISKHSLGVVLSLIKSYNFDLCRIVYKNVNDETELIDNDKEGRVLFQGNGLDAYLYCKRKGANECTNSRNIVNREFLKKNEIAYYEGITHEDTYFTNKLFLNAQKAIITSFCIYYYRRNNNSITNSKQLVKKRKTDLIFLYSLLEEWKKEYEYKGKSRLVLDFMIYQQLCRIINIFSSDSNYKLDSNTILHPFMPQFKKEVFRQIFHEFSLVGILHRIAFVINPSFILARGKHLW